MTIYGTIESITYKSPGNPVLAEIFIGFTAAESSTLGRAAELEGFLRIGYAELAEIAGWKPGQRLVIELKNGALTAVKEAA